MRKKSISILLIFLFGLAGNSFGTSPQPEEVKPGTKETVCKIHVIYSPDSEKGIEKGEASSIFAFETSVSRKDVLDKMAGQVGERLKEADVSEFRLECKFAK